MPGAVIVIDQIFGAGAGTPGVARNDLWELQEVTLHVGTTGNTSYQWDLLNRPAGSSAEITNPLLETATFTPDAIGTYRIRLVVNGGGPSNIQILIARVRFDNLGVLKNRGWAYPAVGEQDGENNYPGNDRSWDEIITYIFEDIRINGMGGGLPPVLGEQYAVMMEDPAGDLVFARVAQEMIIPAFAIASFSKTAPDGGTLLYRRGDSISLITASSSYTSGPPVSASVANTFGGSTAVGDVDPGSWTNLGSFTSWGLGGTVLRNGTDLGADPTMTATLSALKYTTKQDSWSITWTSDIWYGVGDAGELTEVDVKALAGTTLATSKNRTITVSPSNQKVYYAYPKAYGAASFTLNGFPAAFNAAVEISLTNINGVLRTYYVYESVNLLTGTNLAFVVT